MSIVLEFADKGKEEMLAFDIQGNDLFKTDEKAMEPHWY